MSPKNSELNLRAIFDRFSTELSAAIASHVELRVNRALAAKPTFAAPTRSGKTDLRRGGRLCPVPGCGQPGAGPRNRWFCRDHAKKLSATEQRSILERNKRLAAEGKLPTQVPSQRIVRLPPKAPRTPRTLDMSCRVEGCPNRSRGPRAGFICETHRLQLTPQEQLEARIRWKARLGQKSAQLAQVPERPGAPSPVPPIVRKAAEPAAEGG
ncbi:MAG TPA: hypothetical protein VN874_01915 [Myxococcales bacterium]|jgi:hypothetical protein|nr:hypothetical protein [Myxococcales bacterium]